MSEIPKAEGQDPSLLKGNTSEIGRAVMMENDARQWHQRIDELMFMDSRIITFRGAGTVNGIDPNAATKATEQIIEYVTRISEEASPVVIMFDGDEDNRERPDVGSIFGVVADAFSENSNVMPLTAQTQSWYYPKEDGGALESANGTTYETYVFPDDMPGSHAALTQSEKLAMYKGYEQMFVGPAGPIAFSQLQDVNDKAIGRTAEEGPLPVTIIETPINHDLDQVFQAQLEAATDDSVKEKVQTKIDQRVAHPYGALATQEGVLPFGPTQYPNLELRIVKV